MGRHHSAQLREHPGHTGFSLVELVIALAIGAILFALALPEFSQTRANSKIRAAAAQLQQDLQWTRGEAIKRNQRIQLQLSNSTNSTPCAWTVARLLAGGGSETLRQTSGNDFSRQYSHVTCTANQPTLSFGTLGEASAGASYTFSYNDSTMTPRQWQITVSTAGRIVSRIVPGT